MSNLPIELSGSFRTSLDTLSPEGIITIFDAANIFNSYLPLENTYFVGYSLQLEKLQTTVDLRSFAKAPIPNIAPEDTQAERNAKLSEVESRFAKIGLSIYQNSGEGFKRTGIVILQNRGNEYYQPLLVPYLTLGEVELLGKNDKLGVQINNLGFGILGVGDYIIVSGTWKAKISFTPKTAGGSLENIINFGAEVLTTLTLLRPSNPNRKLLYLTNNTNRGCYIYFGNPEGANFINNAPYLSPGGVFNYRSDLYNLPSEIW